MYAAGTVVITRSLTNEPAEENATSPVILVTRNLSTGEVYNQVVSHYRDAQAITLDAARWDTEILLVIEGEGDMSTGKCSAWVER